MYRSRGRPEWPTHTQLHAITTCRASRAITDLFHGLASKWIEKVNFLHYTFFLFFFFTFFAAMLKWSLKLESCRTNTSLRVYATRHYNHEYRIRFSNFTLQMRKIIYRKVSSTVRSGAEERTFWGARLDVLIFRLRSYRVLIIYTADFNGHNIRETLMFLGQAGMFLSFQPRPRVLRRPILL